MADRETESRFPYLIAIVLVILLINSIRSILDIHSSIGRIDKAKAELQFLESENEEFQKAIAYAKTPEYLHKVAIEELNMAKPGETILIVEQMTPESIDKEESIVYDSKPEPLELWMTYFNLQDVYFDWKR